MLPKAGPAGPSFPAAATTSVSRRSAPATARASGLSLKAANGSTSGIERDPGRVVGVAVPVRVDGALEPGEQLVGPRVDRVPAAVVGLPARDPDREHGRGGCDAGEPGRAARPDEQAGHLGAVAFELRRIGRLRLCAGVGAAAEHVEPVENVPVQVRLVQVDAGVEQRDRHAAAGDPGQPDAGRRPSLDAIAALRRTREETDAGNATRTG